MKRGSSHLEETNPKRSASWPLKEVSVGLKLLSEHELAPVLNDEGVWGQVSHRFEDLLVLLNLTLEDRHSQT